MTSTQLLEWELMFERWNMGSSPHERDDLSAAIISHTIASTVTKKPPALDKFLPTFEKPVEQTAEQQAATLRDQMLKAAKRKPGKTSGNDQQTPS